MEDNSGSGSTENNRYFLGGGEMAELMGSINWSTSSLGPVSEWPQILRTGVNIILQSPAPMVILWGKEGITLYNDAYKAFVGKKHPDLLGKRCEQVWPEAADFFRNVIENCLKGNNLSYRKLPYKIFRNHREEDIWMDLECSPLYGENGISEGVLIVNHEVTHFVKAEENQKEAEERYELAMDASGMVGTWDWKIQEDKVYSDFNFSSLYSVDPIKGKEGAPISEYLSGIHPEDKERVCKAIEEAIATKEKYHQEYRLVLKDGSEKWVIAQGRCYYDQEDKPYRFSGVAVDITNRKKAEQALVASEKRFRRISDSNMVGIFNWSIEGQVLEANDAFLEMTGFSREDLEEGKINWRTMTPIEFENSTRQAFIELDESGSFKPFEKEFIRKDGSRAKVILGGTFFENSHNQGISWVLDITEQKQIQEELKKSENEYRAIADSMPQIIWTTKPDGYHDYYNKRWYDFVGKSFEETEGEGWNAQFHPEDQERAWKVWRHSLETGDPYEIEYRLRSKNGGYRWFLGQALPYRDEKSGEIIRWFGTCTDIHDHKMSKEALAESEERFSSIFNQTFVGIAQTDLSGKFMVVNDRFCQITGRSKEELQNAYVQDITHPDDLKVNALLLEQVCLEGTPFKLEKRYVRPDGSIVWVHVSVSAVKDSQGKPVSIVRVCQDISEHKQAEEVLRESEERFRSLADQAPMIIYMVEPDEAATMSYFNKTWLTYTGQTFESAIGNTWNNIVHPDDLPGVFDIYVPAFKEHKPYTLPEVRLRRHDGEYRWHLFKGTPRYLPDGRFMGFIGVGIDIHDRKMIYEQLELKNEQLVRINNDLDNFIYTASHDLKAPISNIEGLITALQSSLSEESQVDGEASTLIKMVNQSVDRLKNTIKDLAEVAKVQNNFEEDNSELLFKEMLEEVKLNIKPEIDQANALISDDFLRAPLIWFSSRNLRSIIYNLVSNAVKYRSPERQVEIFISTERADKEHVLLCVQDNGLGIKIKDKEKVFNMFRRFHQHVEGTGIGLSIVKKIVDNNGGKIKIESEEGKGTLFKVYLKNKNYTKLNTTKL